ncbi:Sec63 complex subunit SEC62 KNAG_0A01790 [Huiozyma naganishii CBS 8797]|uniref:Translocation protein SEC62 n=1 Tax=Huiozyma naganishii (strain ATCC MYA-139 / BCRC 22969 / CBS 8797 / KCTC 17520 / NBRC 10181 / NCYC 3082 / Yp74L-3) TaxID=1071383 RepID=J7RE86_HUIN7|nr:hypothetical protein KNAG_0A01790 [Kazachstania naganishii CBS 8797]CCK67868.1 hypothetical protein KNAG_0A01790 [Kazachstania naganishii CBS 8797]
MSSNPQSPMMVAKLVRWNKELKQRKGLFQGTTVDFFRYKRFIRALHSEEYTKKSRNQPDLYPPVDPAKSVQEDTQARDLFVILIQSRIVLPVTKLHSEELAKHDLKPNKDHPHLAPTDKAILQPDVYFMWNFNPKTWRELFTVVGIVAALLTLVCYPLWPRSMRRGTYYISLGAMWLLLAFFAIALIRLVLAVLSYPLCKNNMFWLFPNFFEDCGVIESFKPLYGFGDKETYSYIKKQERAKKRLLKKQKMAEKQAPIAEKQAPIVEKQTPKLEEIPDEGN